MNKSNIKILLVLLLFFSILGIFLYVFSGKKGNDVDSTEYNEIELVNNPSVFFSVALNINKFCEYLNENNNISAYNVLDVDFTTTNSINIDNILEKYGSEYENVTFSGKEIYVVSNKELYKYYVKGYLKKEQMDEYPKIQSEVYYILNYNIDKSVFSIEIIDKEIYLKSIKSKNFVFKEIDKNSNNVFENTTIIQSSLVSMYFYDFVRNLFSNPEYAYNSLSTDTKKNNFESYESFINEINNNNEYYSNIILSEYNVSNNNYYYKDNYGNIYTFIVSGVMNYSVTIDFSEIKE